MDCILLTDIFLDAKVWVKKDGKQAGGTRVKSLWGSRKSIFVLQMENLMYKCILMYMLGLLPAWYSKFQVLASKCIKVWEVLKQKDGDKLIVLEYSNINMEFCQLKKHNQCILTQNMKERHSGR